METTMSKSTVLRVTACLVATLVFGARRSDATSIVVPNANVALEAGANSFIPFSAQSQTFQYLLAGSQFAAVPIGSQFTSIGWRRDGSESTGPTAAMTYTTYDILLSTSLNPIGSLSSTFANNVGPDVTTVRSGAFTLGANALTGGATPNPFYMIAFTTPYTYLGGDLLIELRHSATAPDAGGIIRVDANLLDSLADSVLVTDEGPVAHRFNYPITQFTFERATAPVPEPASLSLLGLGLASIGARRWRQRKS
jgi:PEP-CTERM motif